MTKYSYNFTIRHEGRLLLESNFVTSEEGAEAERVHDQLLAALAERAFPEVPVEEVTLKADLDDFYIEHGESYLRDGRLLVHAQTPAAKAWVNASLPNWMTLGQSQFTLDERFEHGFSALLKYEGFRVYAAEKASVRDMRQIELFKAFIDA